jgi:hypothetical protein
MTKSTHYWEKVLVVGAVLLVLLGLSFLVAAPTGQVQAAEASQGSPADACQNCHSEVYVSWLDSKHGSEETNCFACHKLGEGQGAHPQVSYLNLPESETCDVCHVDITNEWLSSRHGVREMGCITCHEPHSQHQKIIEGNQSTCENCHRTQVQAAHDSTHGAAGLNCASCHLGPEIGHTFIAEISTCQACHSDIHEANSLIRGVSITPVPSDVKPRVLDTAAQPERGGINLPTWLFFVIGLAMGGGAVWVLIERELDVDATNGKSKKDEEAEEGKSEDEKDE